jgi:hypothetical protein
VLMSKSEVRYRTTEPFQLPAVANARALASLIRDLFPAAQAGAAVH